MFSEMWLSTSWSALVVFVGGIIAVLIYTWDDRNNWSDNKKSRSFFRTVVTLLFVTVFITSFLLFLPIYWDYFGSEKGIILKLTETLVLSVHNTIRLFIVDADYDIIKEFLADKTGVSRDIYSFLSSIIYVLAPLLTFSFVLTFFRKVVNGNKMISAFKNDMYVFSELNARSLILARDIRKNHKKAAIVFTSTHEDSEDEEILELVSKAKQLRAILLENRIDDIKLGYQSYKKKLYLIMIGNDEDDNLIQSLNCIKKFGHFNKTALYLISYRNDVDAIFDGTNDVPVVMKKKRRLINKYTACSDDTSIEIHQINPARDLIDNLLFKYGNVFFKENTDGRIGVAIIGLGEYGTLMLKALSWYLQMDNYYPELYAFDIDENVKKRLKLDCPGMLGLSEEIREKGNIPIPGEAYYDIRIHGGIDAFSEDVVEKIKEMNKISYVFISLGNGEKNIQVARNLRVQFERMGVKPVICAVSYSDEMNKVWEKHLKYRNKNYDIGFIGTMEEQYREDVIMHIDTKTMNSGSDISDESPASLQKRAFALHMSYYVENNKENITPEKHAKDFWSSEYCYHSSIAAIIHMEAKKFCGVAGFARRNNDECKTGINGIISDRLTKEENKAYMVLEHRRWNAYMRSEGYIFSETRNDLGKMHPDLKPYEGLEEDIQEKDMRLERHIIESWKKYKYLYTAIDADS